MICRDLKSVLPDLLLDPSNVSNASARAHLDSCPACREELRALEATFTVLDVWQAPEPSPYFDQKLSVRLREEQEKAPAGWLERMRARLLFNTGRQFRPALAGALALVLLVGGGTFANFSGLHMGKTQTSATVNDLQIFEKNDQALQTMDILEEDASADDGAGAVPAS
jgi:predicted anti-sigma-YlaC factor YlaD